MSNSSSPLMYGFDAAIIKRIKEVGIAEIKLKIIPSMITAPALFQKPANMC